jgi:hypothetical protein
MSTTKLPLDTHTHTYEIIKEKKDLIEREAYGFVFVFSLVIRG